MITVSIAVLSSSVVLNIIKLSEVCEPSELTITSADLVVGCLVLSVSFPIPLFLTTIRKVFVTFAVPLAMVAVRITFLSLVSGLSTEP
ncbi:hypothetical protein D3C85_1824080 [compost metagenome]